MDKFIFLIVLVLAIGCIIGLIVLWGRIWRRLHREPTCGKCGYIVRGLSTFTCPECGSDLREVGIDVARPLRPRMFALWWTLLYLPPAIVVVTFLWLTGGVTSHRYMDMRLVPKSAVYVGVEVIVSAGQSNGANDAPPASIQLTVSSTDVQYSTMMVSPSTLRYRTQYGKGWTLDTQAIERWMMRTGVPVHRAGVKAEAQELLAMIQAAKHGELPSNFKYQHFFNAGAHPIWTVSPVIWYRWATALAAVAVYMLGYVLYFMLRKRGKRSVGASPVGMTT